MQAQAEAMHFEEAARLRDQIQALTTYAEKQKIVSQDVTDRDVFAVHADREEGMAVGVVFQIREGKMIGRRHQTIREVDGRPDEELILAFVERYYAEATFVPEEVLLSHDPAAHPRKIPWPSKTSSRASAASRCPSRCRSAARRPASCAWPPPTPSCSSASGSCSR